MKNITSLALAGALTTAVALGAVTDPVGYTTETLTAGQFNLFGITLHEPVVYSGTLTGVTATELQDTNADFTTVLTPGTVYIVEIGDAAAATADGIVQDFTSFTATSLTVPDFTGLGLAAGDPYRIRAAATVSSIFGATNEAGLLGTAAFDPTTADLILIPTGGGNFVNVYYSTFSGFEGWFTAGGAPADDLPVVYTSAIYVQRRGLTDLDITLTGAVKVDATLVGVADDFNYISTFPAGSTLANSGLSDSVLGTAAFDPTAADLVLIPDGAGNYNGYYYSTFSGFEGWFSAGGAPADATPLTSGIIIQKRAPAAYNALISPGFTL